MRWAILPVAALLAGCFLAGGAGEGGAVRLNERHAEATLPETVTAIEAVAKRTFREMGITHTRTIGERGSAGIRRTMEATLDARKISVAIHTAGKGSKVVVSARKSATTWDRDLARKILEKIVQGAAQG